MTDAAAPDRKKFDLSTLLTIQACEALGHLAVDQEACKRAIERAVQLGREKYLAGPLLLAHLAQHSILFAVDRDTLRDAVRSADESPPSLPPLPFKNIIFEADTDDVWTFGAEGFEIRLEAAFVTEAEEGAAWGAVLFVTIESDPHPRTVSALQFDIYPDKIIYRDTANGTSEQGEADEAHRRFIIEAIHFITARGVSLVEITPSRPARRRADRAGYALPACVYSVEIKDVICNVVSGQSERTYRCRWLVRGHWRTLPDLRKTWIRPYIKGPPGAPWRGRPVYHVAATA